MAAGSYLYWDTHHNNNTASSTADTNQHAGPATDKDSKTSDTTTTSTSQQVANPDHPIASTLAKPIGPNNNTGTVSLSSGATGMESTCRSVPGVGCYIQGTLNGRTVVLSQTKTITNGTSDGVILVWDAKQLSAGNWLIYAEATKDGQQTLSDPQMLRVNP